MDNYQKYYRFLRANIFNEEVFKIKLKMHLDADVEAFEGDKEYIKQISDALYNSEQLITDIKINFTDAKECECYDDFDDYEKEIETYIPIELVNHDGRWDCVNEPLTPSDSCYGKEFCSCCFVPNVHQFLKQYGFNIT